MPADRCQGITAAGVRCKISVDSLYCGHTIPQHGYCSKHLSQRPQSRPGAQLLGMKKHQAASTWTSSLTGEVYPLPERDPAIVAAARKGDLGRVKAILDAAEAESVAQTKKTINACAKWTEVEDKMGGLYEKSWEWDSDTALIAAAREGHVEVVLELLCRGADVSKKSCPLESVHETAVDAVKKKKNQRTRVNGDVLLEMLGIAAKNKTCLAPKKLVANAGKKKSAQQPEGKSADGGQDAGKPKVITSLQELKLPELKELLVKYKKPVSGTKAKLIERLSDCPEAVGKWNALRLEKWEAAQKLVKEEQPEEAGGDGTATTITAPAAAASSSSSSGTTGGEQEEPVVPEAPAATTALSAAAPVPEAQPAAGGPKRAKVVASLRAVALKAQKIVVQPSPPPPSPGALARRAAEKAKHQAVIRKQQSERERQQKALRAKQQEQQQHQHVAEVKKKMNKKSKAQKKRERKAQRKQEEAERRRQLQALEMKDNVVGGVPSGSGTSGSSSSSSKLPCISGWQLNTLAGSAGGIPLPPIMGSSSSSSSTWSSAFPSGIHGHHGMKMNMFTGGSVLPFPATNTGAMHSTAAAPVALPSSAHVYSYKRPAVTDTEKDDLSKHVPGGSTIFPAAKTAKADPLLCWGCGKRFADRHGITQHQWDSTKCKASARYRGPK